MQVVCIGTYLKCSPIALDNGTTAPVMMLFPYRKEPDTGSRIPSMSTGGAAMKAMMYTVVAVNTLGLVVLITKSGLYHNLKIFKFIKY